MSTPFVGLEKEVMDNLVKALNAFVKLEQTHPSHTKDFADGIHKCQDIILHRIVQREYPDTFPTYKDSNVMAQDIRDALNIESTKTTILELDAQGAKELARYASLELFRETGVARQIENAIMLHQYRLMINQNHAKINQLYNAAKVLGFTTSFVSGGSLAYGFYIEW